MYILLFNYSFNFAFLFMEAAAMKMDGDDHSWKSRSEILYRKSFLFNYDVESFSSHRLSRDDGMFMADDHEEEQGLSLSVPFTWESQPGTPKVMWFLQNRDQTPLLTPPPSYSYCTPARPPTLVSQIKTNPKKKGFFRSIFPRFRSRKKESSAFSSSS